MIQKYKYLIGVINQMNLFKANTCMFFSKPPQSWKKVATSKMFVPEFLNLIAKNKFELKNFFIHASYLINLANLKSEKTLTNSIFLMELEIKRAIKLHVSTIVLHPGCYLNFPKKKALDFLIKNLDSILAKYPNIKIALETMAGQGTQLCDNFEDLSYILKNLKHQNQVGVCIDTCHIFAAGYDIKNNFEQVLNQFEFLIGIEKLFLIHLNDSKFNLNSKMDRHENINQGYIGLKALQKIVFHPKLINVAKVLETPFLDKKPIYKEEILLLRNKK